MDRIEETKIGKLSFKMFWSFIFSIFHPPYISLFLHCNAYFSDLLAEVLFKIALFLFLLYTGYMIQSGGRNGSEYRVKRKYSSWDE